MSIRGIDAQMMITRAPDVAKEANTQLKSGEKMQEFLAVQAQAEAEHEKSSIPKTDAAPKAELRTGDERGRKSREGEAGGRHRKGEEGEAPSLLDVDVGHGESIIDITL